MHFGESLIFAIEAYHEPAGSEWVGYGRMALNIGGIRLGDIGERHCSLFDAVDRFREVYPRIDSLWSEAFDGLSDREMFDLIDAYYSGKPCEADLRRFDFLTNTGEQFDDVKTFIICRPSGRVCILYEFRDGSFGSASCPIASFREVAKEFVDWFEGLVSSSVLGDKTYAQSLSGKL